MKKYYNLNYFKKVALKIGIKIKNAKNGDHRKVGIHLFHPNLRELADALQDAERDGFKTIYIHNVKTWPKSQPEKY